MEFIPLESNSTPEDAESDCSFGISEASRRRELKEQDLLRRLEEFSGDKSDAMVDCNLKLGFSSDTKPKTSRFDLTPQIDVPPIICGAPQVMGMYGMMSRGWSTYNNCRWESLGSRHMNLLPNMACYGTRSDGYGFFGHCSMASSPPQSASKNGFTGVSNPQSRMTRLNQSKTKREVGGCVRKCAACETTNTPLWRNGPKGSKSLCNACGIRFKKEERKKEEGKTSGIMDSGTKLRGGGVKEHESSKKTKI